MTDGANRGSVSARGPVSERDHVSARTSVSARATTTRSAARRTTRGSVRARTDVPSWIPANWLHLYDTLNDRCNDISMAAEGDCAFCDIDYSQRTRTRPVKEEPEEEQLPDDDDFEHLGRGRDQIAQELLRERRAARDVAAEEKAALAKDVTFDHEAAASSFQTRDTSRGLEPQSSTNASSNLRKAKQEPDPPLISAAKRKDVDDMRIELRRDPKCVNSVDGFGQTALFFSVGIDTLEMVKMLIRSKADSNIGNKNGYTPFMRACAGGYMQAAELLLEGMSDVSKKDAFGSHPLLMAAIGGQQDIVKWLLDKEEAKEMHSVPDDDGRLPLVMAVKGGYRDISISLLESQASPDERDKDGRVPIFFAFARNDVDLADRMLLLKADLNALDDTNESVILCLVKELFKHKVTANENSANYEIEAATRNRILCGVVSALEHKAHPDTKDEKGHTPISVAVKNDNPMLTAILAAFGANTSSCDENGGSLKGVAKKKQFADTLRVLDEFGNEQAESKKIDPFAVALVRSAYYGHRDACQKMLDKMADVTVKTRRGQLPVDIAARCGYAEVSRMLRNATDELKSRNQLKKNRGFLSADEIQKTLEGFVVLTKLIKNIQSAMRGARLVDAVQYMEQMHNYQLTAGTKFRSVELMNKFIGIRRSSVLTSSRSELMRARLAARTKRLLEINANLSNWRGATNIDFKVLQHSISVGISTVYAEKPSDFEKQDPLGGVVEKHQSQCIDPTLHFLSEIHSVVREEQGAAHAFPKENEKFAMTPLQCPRCLKAFPDDATKEAHVKFCKSDKGDEAKVEWKRGRMRSAETASHRLADAIQVYESRTVEINAFVEQERKHWSICKKESPDVIGVINACVDICENLLKFYDERIKFCKEVSSAGHDRWIAPTANEGHSLAAPCVVCFVNEVRYSALHANGSPGHAIVCTECSRPMLQQIERKFSPNCPKCSVPLRGLVKIEIQ